MPYSGYDHRVYTGTWIYIYFVCCHRIFSGHAVYHGDLYNGMAWQFLSPVMYSVEMVPERFQTVYMYVNPMAPIIIAYRDILYYGRVPELATLLTALVMGVVLFFIGWFTFDRMQRHFAEEM